MCYNKDGVVIDRREMLRVKAKSLAEEARIIRREEKRARPGLLREELHRHRVMDVRSEARATYLAYGLIRGTALEKIERPKEPRTDVLWKRVKAMVRSYGPADRGTQDLLVTRCAG